MNMFGCALVLGMLVVVQAEVRESAYTCLAGDTECTSGVTNLDLKVADTAEDCAVWCRTDTSCNGVNYKAGSRDCQLLSGTCTSGTVDAGVTGSLYLVHTIIS